MDQIILTIPQSHCVIFERFGKYSRTCEQGLRFRVPFFEKVKRIPEWGSTANKKGYLIELTEQQSDTAPRQCHTKDNVAIEANASVYWRITDPEKALYEVDVLPRAVRDIALNALRSEIGKLDLDAILSERQGLNERLATQLSSLGLKWGIQFTRVEIQELTTNDETATAMRQQMVAERKRRALIAEAEGQATAEVRVAKADRDAAILRAQGQAKALELIADAEMQYLQKLEESVTAAAAGQVLVAQKLLDGFDRITKNPAHKVFLPNSFNGLFSLDAEHNPSGIEDPKK